MQGTSAIKAMLSGIHFQWEMEINGNQWVYCPQAVYLITNQWFLDKYGALKPLRKYVALMNVAAVTVNL